MLPHEVSGRTTGRLGARMKLRPIRGGVVVKVDEPEQTGIIQITTPRSCYGVVTASANPKYAVGDRVFFGAQAGTEVDGLLLLRKGEVIAKVGLDN